MAQMSIDELNSPKEFNSEAYIERYFAPMDISEERKEERKSASRDFRDFLLFLFTLLAIQQEYDSVDWVYFEQQFVFELTRNAEKYARNTKLLEYYIAEKAADFTRITREHLSEGEYWVSEERATYEAVNEANTVVGYEEIEKAKDDGFKFKTWVTEKDSKVRKDHVPMEGKKVKIDGYFILPDCMMLMPHDDVNGTPKQTENCRCSLLYTKV